jgi:hypothetical protein
MCDLNASTSSQTKYATWLHLILYFLPICQRTLQKEKTPKPSYGSGVFEVYFYFLYPLVVFATEPLDNTRGYQQLLNCDFTLIICCLIVLIVILYYNYYKDTKSFLKIKLFLKLFFLYNLFLLVLGVFQLFRVQK